MQTEPENVYKGRIRIWVFYTSVYFLPVCQKLVIWYRSLLKAKCFFIFSKLLCLSVPQFNFSLLVWNRVYLFFNKIPLIASGDAIKD